MGTAIKHPVPDRVICNFGIWAVWHSAMNIKVGVKGLTSI